MNFWIQMTPLLECGHNLCWIISWILSRLQIERWLRYQITRRAAAWLSITLFRIPESSVKWELVTPRKYMQWMQIRNRIQYTWTMDSSAECKFNKEYIPRVLSRLLGPRIVLLLLPCGRMYVECGTWNGNVAKNLRCSKNLDLTVVLVARGISLTSSVVKG